MSGRPGGFALDTSVLGGGCYRECLGSDVCGSATALKCSWVSLPYILMIYIRYIDDGRVTADSWWIEEKTLLVSCL